MKEKAKGLEAIDFKNLSRYPDPHLFGSVRERSLWALHVAKEELNIERLGASTISRFLTEIIEIKTSPQAVKYSLDNAGRGCVDKKNRTYKLMQKGRNEISLDLVDERKDIYINSGTPYTSKNQFTEEIISLLSGDIKICDPYIGPRLIDILAKGKKGNNVLILTNNIEDKPIGSFKRALDDLNKEGFKISVRVYNGSELHDRYIIDSNGMWIVGHSLKDLGKKECFIIQVNEDLKASMLHVFDRRWISAAVL